MLSDSLEQVGQLPVPNQAAAPVPSQPVQTPAPKKGRPPVVKPVITTETPAAILQAVEHVNAGVSDAPLVDLTPVTKTAVEMCPNHPKEPVTAYGMCRGCYDKLSKMQQRRLYLDARLHGPNTHNYPSEFLAVWKREIILIDAGLWKGPLKTKAKSKLAEEIMG